MVYSILLTLITLKYLHAQGQFVPLHLSRKGDFASENDMSIPRNDRANLLNALKKTHIELLYPAVAAPLAALAASRLLGCDAMSSNLGIFCCSSLCPSDWTVRV